MGDKGWFFGCDDQNDGDQNNGDQIVVNSGEEYEKEFLTNMENNDVAFFHLNGYKRYAKIVKQYDGDTVHLVFFLNGKLVKFRCRMANIDCAEKKSTNQEEVKCAHLAIDRVRELVGSNGIVYVHFHKFDKYGRILVTLFSVNNKEYSINDILVGEGLAYEYNGGTRIPFTEWAHSSFVNHNFQQNTNIIDNIQDNEALEFEDEIE